MTLDSRQVTAFIAVATHGSLGRAAEALHITQPALSRIIKRLEDGLGVALFERNAKGMRLSAFGEALLPRARLLQQESLRAMEEIQAMRGLSKGIIRVGAIGSIASSILPLAIQQVLARWPKLRIEVVEGVWDRLADALLLHEIDIALGTAMEDSDDICAIADCRWTDASHVVASAVHPLRGQARLSLADTIDQRWVIVPRGTAPYEDMRRLFEQHGLGLPNIVVETRSIVVLKSLVINAGFISWMPAPMYDVERRAGLVDALPIAGARAERTLSAFRRREGLLPAPAAKLIEELRKIAQAPGSGI
jgi:DNA-binding transcriptional LysR family regulator